VRDAARVSCRYGSLRLLAIGLAGLAIARLAVGGFGLGDLLAAGAVAAAWPWLEWTLHVTLLHLRPFTIAGRRIDPEFARRHRAHHREPWRFELIFLPLWVHALTAPLSIALAFALAPSPALALSALVALFAMALQYEWVHFLVHTRVWPRRKAFQRLWRNHRLHHFKSERHWFGFTVVAVDRLMGTAPDPRSVPTSPTCRTLGVD